MFSVFIVRITVEVSRHGLLQVPEAFGPQEILQKLKQSQKGELSMVLLSTIHLLSISAIGPAKAGFRFSTETKV